LIYHQIDGKAGLKGQFSLRIDSHHPRATHEREPPSIVIRPPTRPGLNRPAETEIAMYYAMIQQCSQALKTIEVWLDKAEQHAGAKKFDAGVLMTSRLAPDMREFIYQVQSACDYVKGAAACLSGQTPPRHADTEQTVEELRARIRKTTAFAESVSEAQFAGAAGRAVSWSGKIIGGEDYLRQIAIPNIYFHLTTAYAILRHNGVDIGKRDFLGPIHWAGA
jgi:hypothetical protein